MVVYLSSDIKIDALLRCDFTTPQNLIDFSTAFVSGREYASRGYTIDHICRFRICASIFLDPFQDDAASPGMDAGMVFVRLSLFLCSSSNTG